MKRIAVILCGHLRTWERCKDNFKSFFLDNSLQVDVFVSTYTRMKGFHPFIEQKYNIEGNTEEVSADIINAALEFKPTNIIIEDQTTVENEVKDKLNRNCYGVLYDVYCQYRKIKQGLDMAVEYSSKHNFNYDYVIRTRPDIIYPSSLTLSSIINTTETRGNDCVYTCILVDNIRPTDHFFIGTMDNMRKLINNLMKPTDKTVVNPHQWLVMCTSQDPKLHELDFEILLYRL